MTASIIELSIDCRYFLCTWKFGTKGESQSNIILGLTRKLVKNFSTLHFKERGQWRKQPQ
jgi:hypothetical protein